jgi:hypothetical protein
LRLHAKIRGRALCASTDGGLLEDLIDDERAHELAERVRLFVYAWNRPIARLARDVAGVAYFETMESPLSPQLRLTCAAPPLTPPAAAIVDATVRIWGNRLSTTKSGRLMVGTLAARGPIAGAETFVLQGCDPRVSKAVLLMETLDAFTAIFARYPEIYLRPTRDLLKRYSQNYGETDGRSA